MRYLLLLICLALSGCLTIQYEETAANEIAARGLASIRGSQDKVQTKFVGPRVVRYLVIEIDDPAAKAKRAADILPLTPGERKIQASAYIQLPRFGGYDLHLFPAELTFTAVAGRRYEVRGKGEQDRAALGVYDMDGGKLVSQLAEGTPVLTTAQRAPLFIIIP